MFHVPNKFRVRFGILGSDDSYENNGFFVFPNPFANGNKTIIRVQASDGYGWEHVSVSLENRCPNWKEMCYVKNLFWDDEDCVMQLHPPKSRWVNNHDYCLHLWRPIGKEIPQPDEILVGKKEMQPEEFTSETVLRVRNELGI